MRFSGIQYTCLARIMRKMCVNSFQFLPNFLAYLMIFQSGLSCLNNISHMKQYYKCQKFGKKLKKKPDLYSAFHKSNPKPKFHVPDSSLDSVYSSMDIARAQKTSRRGSVTASPKAKQASSPHAKVQGRPQQCQFLGQQP